MFCSNVLCFNVLWHAVAFSTAFQSKVLCNQSTLLSNAVEYIKLQIAIYK